MQAFLVELHGVIECTSIFSIQNSNLSLGRFFVNMSAGF
jgi:hypothetical protein